MGLVFCVILNEAEDFKVMKGDRAAEAWLNFKLLVSF